MRYCQAAGGPAERGGYGALRQIWLFKRLGGLQSVEDTERVVREAMTAPAAAAAAAARPTLNFDNDDTLDTFMDEQRRPSGGGAAFVAEDEW